MHIIKETWFAIFHLNTKWAELGLSDVSWISSHQCCENVWYNMIRKKAHKLPTFFMMVLGMVLDQPWDIYFVITWFRTWFGINSLEVYWSKAKLLLTTITTSEVTRSFKFRAMCFTVRLEVFTIWSLVDARLLIFLSFGGQLGINSIICYENWWSEYFYTVINVVLYLHNSAKKSPNSFRRDARKFEHLRFHWRKINRNLLQSNFDSEE